MRRFVFLLLPFWITGASPAQESWTIRGYAGLGIAEGSLASTSDYITVVGRPRSRVEDFQTLFELHGGLDIHPLEEWTIGGDVFRLNRSISTEIVEGRTGWEFDLSWTMATLTVRNIIHHDGVSIEVGGGAGYVRAALVERYASQGLETTYSGGGVGVLLQANGTSPFGGGLHGQVALDLRALFPGDIRSDSGNAAQFAGTKAGLALYAIALRFGLTYQD